MWVPHQVAPIASLSHLEVGKSRVVNLGEDIREGFRRLGVLPLACHEYSDANAIPIDNGAHPRLMEILRERVDVTVESLECAGDLSVSARICTIKELLPCDFGQRLELGCNDSVHLVHGVERLLNVCSLLTCGGSAFKGVTHLVEELLDREHEERERCDETDRYPLMLKHHDKQAIPHGEMLRGDAGAGCDCH